MSRFRPELLIIAAAALWGTTGTAQDLADIDASPVVVGVARIALGAAALALIVARSSRSGRAAVSPGTPGRGQNRGLGPAGPIVVGIVAVAAYQATFFAAVDRAGVALGTLVAIGSAPVLTGLVAMTGGERPARRWYPATGLAVVGCALLLAPGGDSELDGLGLGLALGAGLSYALYTVAAKAVLATGVPGPTVMATFFVGGAVVLSPAFVLADTDGLLSGRGIAMTLWLGLATTTAAYVLFSAGLRRLPSSTVATLSLTEPLTAALLGVVVLSERPGLVAALGALVLLSGLLVITSGRVQPDLVGDS